MTFGSFQFTIESVVGVFLEIRTDSSNEKGR